MKAKILTFDVPNLNGRVYPKSVIENAIKKAQSDIEHNRFFVTSHRPERLTVDLRDVVATVDKLEIENNDVIADITLLDIPNALHSEVALKNGDVHVRTNGIGSIKTIDGISYVQDDYELTCCFLTSDPA